MSLLGETVALRGCSVAQTIHQADQLVRRYNSETKHPRTSDPSLHTSNPPKPPSHLFPEKITYTPSSPPIPTDPAPRLSPAAKAGIITACIIIFILLFFLIFEIAYLGSQRRARAVQQARHEVEQGGAELNDVKDGKETKENVVLESRVEIVIEGDDEAQGSSVSDSWGKRWEVEEVMDGEGGVWRRERKGMSLQRREH